MHRPNPLVPIFLAAVALSIFGLLLQRFGGIDGGLVPPILSLVTLMVGAGAIALGIGRARAWLGVIALGATIEIVGVATGLPFGRYEYTDRWWPTANLPGIGFYPLALPFAWLLIAGAAALLLTRWLTGPRLWLAVGLTAATVDLFMEPVVVEVLGYWRWFEPDWPIGAGAFGVPLANFVGWFVASAIAAWWIERNGSARGAEPARVGGVVLAAHLTLLAVIAATGKAPTSMVVLVALPFLAVLSLMAVSQNRPRLQSVEHGGA